MNSIKKNKNGGLIIILFCVFYLHNYPSIAFRFPIVIYWGIVVLLFSLLLNRKYKALSIRNAILIFGLSALSFVITVLKTPLLFGTYMVELLELCIYLMMGQYLIEDNNKKTITFIIIFVLTFYIITSITTNIGCQLYPLASRELADGVHGDSDLSRLYKSMNIGGFDFIYSVVLVVPLLIGTIKIKKKIVYWIIGVPSLLLIGIGVISAQYTTALVVYLLGIASVFLKERNGSVFAPFFYSLLLIIVFVPLLSVLTTMIQGDVLSERVNDILSFLTGEQNDLNGIDGMDERVTRWRMSVDTMFAYPLIGGWIGKGASVGGHSFILDSIAYYGIVGIVLLYAMYKNIYMLFIQKYKNHSCYNYLLYVLVLSILIAVLNPFPNLEFLVFTLPLVGHYLSKQLE